MIYYPNAKINIGLNIIKKRSDGFHDLETVFYPVALNDILEFAADESLTNDVQFSESGISTDSLAEHNLCVKAYRLLKNDRDLQPLKIHLHKKIPIGAGLGGGSSDAAFMLKGLNKYFGLKISKKQLMQYAAQLGSDCAFFIRNKAAYATGRGNKLSNIDLDLKGLRILLIYPSIHISTAEAYKTVTPKTPEYSLADLIKQPVDKWRNRIVNDFEEGLFPHHPLLREIKNMLYDSGAVYASMSGSGSAIYGIFPKETNTHHINYNKNWFAWHGVLQ